MENEPAHSVHHCASGVPKKPTVSLVVPFYNEAEAVASFCASITAIAARLPEIALEIVCVDDGSTDTTLALLLATCRVDSRFKVVELSRNFGKEAALTAGIDFASGDAVVPLDADLQDPPELLPELIRIWQTGAEVVLARRSDRQTDPLAKRATAEMFYRVHNWISQIKIPSNVGDFRLMDRVVVEALKKLPERQRFMKGLFTWVGFKSVTIDYSRPARAAGKSKFSAWKLWNFALEGITSFSTAPLKVWVYIGMGGAAASLVYAGWMIVRTLLFGIDVPGYASLLVAILFIGSLQLVGIGILGEYIGRIYIESKQRPAYLIRKLHGYERTP